MANGFDMGTRRFGRVNWLGLATLASREVQRFMAVWTQTLLAAARYRGAFPDDLHHRHRSTAGRRDGRRFHDLPGTGHPDDDGDPERVCQYLFVHRDRQGAGQYRRYADAAAVARGNGAGLPGGWHRARADGGRGHRGGALRFSGHRGAASALGALLRDPRVGVSWRLGHGRGDLSPTSSIRWRRSPTSS